MRLDGDTEDDRPADEPAFKGQQRVGRVGNRVPLVLAAPHGIHRATVRRLKPSSPPNTGFVAVEDELTGAKNVQPPAQRFGRRHKSEIEVAGVQQLLIPLEHQRIMFKAAIVENHPAPNSVLDPSIFTSTAAPNSSIRASTVAVRRRLNTRVFQLDGTGNSTS